MQERLANRTHPGVEAAGEVLAAELTNRARGLCVPVASYRLQFNRDFTFTQALEIVEYLRDLGISDCYASPIFRACAQSTHGYDVCSFEEINPALGGLEGFKQFATRLRELGMGLLVDMVPNHMAADSSNPWWWDVLKYGHGSRYSDWFDIDWERPEPELHGKVLLPILEDDYTKVLHAGKLRLVNNSQGEAIAYYDRQLPISGTSVPPGEDAAVRTRAAAILDYVLQRQPYRLAHWRLAPKQINYRRFFDITDLVSLRMELPEVFQATHELLLGLIRERLVTGLRIDHPDGLWDPKEYCERLQTACQDASVKADNHSHPCPFYVVVEKILTGDERLPDDWPVCGTTGYDFLNRLNGLYVSSVNESAFDRIYSEFCPESAQPFTEIAYRSKKLVLQNSFVAELNALTRRVEHFTKTRASARDLSSAEIRDALVEIIAAFPVYRTYVSENTSALSARDAQYMRGAIRAARKVKPELKRACDLLGRLLQLQPPGDAGEHGLVEARRFVMRFQQLTAPAMAKGLEDTAFYNYNRLVSLNDVGGDPGTFGTDLATFHRQNEVHACSWPHSLLATATHDTKRGEDLRARINVLSEIPDEWEKRINAWRAINAEKKSRIDGAPAPDANDEYLLYQTLVGTWPFEPFDLCDFRERIEQYMLKAAKEAKAHTSWTEPNARYEQALQAFIERILAAPGAFLDSFRPFQRRVAYFGQFNSLSQTALKLTAPGVPDFYQGTELWDFSLVDPDNRRPVDFQVRRELLQKLTRTVKRTEQFPNRDLLDRLLAQSFTGEIKLYLIWRLLQCRRQHRKLFENGSYESLSVEGVKQAHACAFARTLADSTVITIAPRLVVGLTHGIERLPIGDVWRDTVLSLPRRLAARAFRNVLTGETVTAEITNQFQLSEIFAHFTVAVLEPADR